ncbi:MAG: response regulator [Ignavibacteria bacterium]|jgi:DNA-binding response OmpR family regulator
MFKVLVIDDDPNVNLFISRLLTKKFKCEVVTAVNGLEGLSKIKEDNPEVVFLDVTMPVMDGIETLQAIRSDNNYKKLPVVMLTAVREKDVVGKVMNMNIIDYVLKPLMYDETFKRIKEIFDKIRELQKAEKDAEEEISKNIKKEKLLVVDTDKKFIDNFKNVLGNNYKIFECDNGADGMKIFMKEKPPIVCLGENLPLLNEKMLAKKIKNSDASQDVTIFMVRENPVLTEEDKELFDCIVPRSGGINFIEKNIS